MEGKASEGLQGSGCAAAAAPTDHSFLVLEHCRAQKEAQEGQWKTGNVEPAHSAAYSAAQPGVAWMFLDKISTLPEAWPAPRAAWLGRKGKMLNRKE